MMTLPLVSIHIICFNQEGFIRHALESAAEQDYPNLEIVVSDDCSTDSTQAIINQTIAQYPQVKFVKIFNPINLGITVNSNKALSLCKGEFIAFMGGDDVLLPGKITQQVNFFRNNKDIVLCGHDVEWIDRNGMSMKVKTSDFISLVTGQGATEIIRNGNPFAATSVMVKRERLPSYGFHPWLPIVSDWKLWIDVISKDGCYGYVDGVLAQYRRHPGSATFRRNYKILRDVILTAVLSVWHFHGRFITDWLYYFFMRMPIKFFREKPNG